MHRIPSRTAIVTSLLILLAGNCVIAQTKCVHFENGGHVEVKNSAGILDLNKNFTVEMWVRWEKAPRNEYFAGDEFWRKSPNSTVGWVLRKRYIKAEHYLEFSFATIKKRWVHLRKKISPGGKLSHIAVTRIGGTIRLFLNGKILQKLDASRMRFKPSGMPFYIGPRNNCPVQRFFDGQVLSFRVSTNSRYDATFRPKKLFENDQNTIILYDLDQNSRKKLIDKSNGGHDGILGDAVIVDYDMKIGQIKKAEKNHRKILRSSPVLNKRILQFAWFARGRKVGSGDCWEFVNVTMNAAGAKKRGVYVFGRPVTKAQAKPGDLIQLEAYNEKGIRTYWHSAILWRKHSQDKIEIINANAPPLGNKVGIRQIILSKMIGKMTFYRPERK